jgi:hypothetical protein
MDSSGAALAIGWPSGSADRGAGGLMIVKQVIVPPVTDLALLI